MSAIKQAKLDATAARLDDVAIPAGRSWITTARKDALSRVRAMGLPSRRDEYWKYTRPETLTQGDVVPAALFKTDEAPLFDQV